MGKPENLTDGKSSDGKSSDGKNSDGKNSDGKNIVEKNSDGRNSDGKNIVGKAIAEKITANLHTKVKKHHQKQGIKPSLVVILVGDNPASEVYVDRKKELATNLGFTFNLVRLSNTATQGDLARCINEHNISPDCHAILVQLPLPEHINAAEVLGRIDPRKDVDGLHPHNFGRLALNLPAHYPCTALAVMDCINACVDDVSGLDVAIVGKSNLVGKPLAMMLSNLDATVSLCHKGTKNLKNYTKTADIVVVAIGVPGYITADFIREGAIVIDVGITLVDGVVCGDVLQDDVAPKAKYITPVPGGVGPLTVARLMTNTYDAMEMIAVRGDDYARNI